MEKSTLSIILPSYNQESYLPDAIESALAQTAPVKEIIVIDDGSTDSSLSIAKSYEGRGVKVIAQTNRGLPSARNTGIMNATSDYILPLDADDMLLENCVERIMEKAEETKADIIAPSFKTFGLANQEVILQGGLIAKSFVYANRIGYFSAFKREKAIAIGGYSPKMIWGWEDLHFWINMLLNGATVSVIQEPLVLYRIKEQSMITDANVHTEELLAQLKKDFPTLYES